MTTPSAPDREGSDSRPDPVDLHKSERAPEDEPGFDPYRFGKPDVPPPPEYAPPGYVPPADAPRERSGGYPPPPIHQPSPYGPPGGDTPPGHGPPAYGPPGHGGYGPPGYATGQSGPPGGPPQPPQYHGYVQPRTGNGKATASLVLGIVSIVLCWATIFDAVLIIPAIVFGILGLNEARSGRAGGRGLAIAGLTCAAIGAILAIVMTVVFTRAINSCGGVSEKDSSGFQQCVQNYFVGNG